MAQAQREKDGAILEDGRLAEALSPASCDLQKERQTTGTSPDSNLDKVR